VAPAQARRRRRLGWTLLTLIMLGIVGVVTWAILSSINRAPGTATVPLVKGLNVDEAKQKLSSAGFTPDVKFAASDTVAKDLVIEQDPTAGTILQKEKVVIITVSSGRGNATVPDLRGKTKAEAIKALEDAGLVLGTVSDRASTDKDKGKVVSQSIPAGTSVERRQKVNIVLGKGPETAIVPNVFGETEAQATTDLKAAGFEVKVQRSSEGGCVFQPGRVCSQSPDSGTTQQKGSVVTITVGESPTDSPSPTPS
jgi:beta-lactam-binding protein with PASTA domain